MALEKRLAALAPALGDALYASRAGHTEDFHRDVVLPLRRAVHNGRDPRPALLHRLDGLPDRVPELRAWLAARGRREELLTALRSGAAPALAAGRSELAGLCREPAFLRAASFTSADLLRAVVRAGQDGPVDRRARKEEAGVLRHVTRAVARTTPLSAFTAVGWGVLPGPSSGGEVGSGARSYAELEAAGAWNDAEPGAARSGAAPETAGAWSPVELPLGSALAVVRANRTLVETLFAALAADPRRRSTLPIGCAAVRVSPAGVSSSPAPVRPSPPRASSRWRTTRSPSARRNRCSGWRSCAIPGHARRPGGDARRGRRGPDRRGERPAALDAASAFVRQVCDAGLLVPVKPFGPQDPDPLPGLARWLRSTGTRQDHEPALRIQELATLTAEFGTAEPGRRAALLATLRDRWATLLDEVGHPVGPAPGRLTVLSEDVVLRQPVPLDGFLDGADHQAVAELASLAEVFDLGPVIRRQVRDSFVERYGPGGVCPHVWDFGAAADEAWQRAARAVDGADGDTAARTSTDGGSGATAADGVRRLAALRAELVASVHRAHADSGGGPDDDVVLPPGPMAALPPGCRRGRHGARSRTPGSSSGRPAGCCA